MEEKVPILPNPQYNFGQKRVLLWRWVHNEVKGLAQAAGQWYHQEYTPNDTV